MAGAIFPLLLITGSRAGLMLGVVGAVIGGAISLSGHRHKDKGRSSALRRAAIFAPPLLVGIGAVGGAVYLARDIAVRRLMDGSGFEDRTQYFQVFVHMIRDFFPLGSGFGSFASVYRHYEPYELLDLNYLNHAHNDLAEILIEGGIAAMILLLLFLVWWLVRCWRLWSAKPSASSDLLGRTGTGIALLLLLSSFVDYPLRTPLLSTLMAIACSWMLRSAEGTRHLP
jgi:O-antigen ligase